MENVILQRIKKIIEYTGLSDRKFSESIGVPQTTLSSLFQRDSDPSVSLVQAILYSYPNISMPWLLFGNGKMLITRRGEMLKTARETRNISIQQAAKAIGVNVNYYIRIESGEVHLNEEYKNILIEKFDIDPQEIPEDIYPDQLIGGCENRPLVLPPDEWLPENNKHYIPTTNFEHKDEILKSEKLEVQILNTPKCFESTSNQEIALYDINAAANLKTLLGDKSQNIIGKISIPDIPKCDGAVYVKGDSMYPLLKSGDIIAYKEVHNFDNVVKGEMYLVSFELDGDEYLTVKYVNSSDKDGCVKLVSYNTHHDPMDIPINSIYAMALVKVSIRMNTMR